MSRHASLKSIRICGDAEYVKIPDARIRSASVSVECFGHLYADSLATLLP